MTTKKQQEVDLWLGFASDALGVYEPPDDLDGDQVDDMAAFCADFADAMLDQFDERFTEKKGRRSSRRRTASKDDDE